MNRRKLLTALSAAAFCAQAGIAFGRTDAALEAAINGPDRTPANRLRDPYRHPYQSLTFWGLKPGMTVVEIDPGRAGYWSEILTAYVKTTGGHYIAAAMPEFVGPGPSEPLGVSSPPIAPAGTVDLVLTARNIHNMLWVPGLLPKALKDFHDALKPNGILAIEEHRADPKPQVDTGSHPASNGYVAVATVVNAVTKAGFRLDGSSEINANPKDTKDYPFGVWTLPPTRVSSRPGQPTPPGFDRTKYDAIGESDRMTLRFRKI